jgi:hypothetical protein
VLGNTATLKGVWIGGGLGFCNGNTAAAPPSLNPGAAQQGAAPQAGRAGGAPAGRAGGFGRGAAAGPCTPIPYMAWTRGVSDDRRRMQLEPHTRCKPSGGPRQWLTPYGAEFLELPDAKVAYIFDIGGPHTYRTIYMDGRKHPQPRSPSFYGHSIGSWEGDTLVVDTVGFNEGFWIDRGQLPHTSQLHLIEKYTRTALDTMKYELTIDDPGAYTSTFTGVLQPALGERDGAVRIRLPAGELRAHPDGRRRNVGGPHEHDRSLDWSAFVERRRLDPKRTQVDVSLSPVMDLVVDHVEDQIADNAGILTEGGHRLLKALRRDLRP